MDDYDEIVLAHLAKIEAAAEIGVQNSHAIFHGLYNFREDSQLLSGRQACWAMPRDTPISSLSDVEFRVFSQWGEDGIIEWLVSHVDVPSRRFIEFGVQTFREANCRFLMLNRNWRGLIMDGSEAHIEAAARDTSSWKHDLTAIPAFVTAENINSLIVQAGFSAPLGLLSIDVDGNDYWIWNAISVVNPAIVVCEYNGILGDTRPISIPYDPAFQRFNAHYSGLYAGCSITALIHLASQRGYTFVGTASNGVNAFFVRTDLAAPVLKLVRTVRAFPKLCRDSHDRTGKLNHLRGLKRLEAIQHLPVVDVTTGERMLLRDIDGLYSDAWLNELSRITEPEHAAEAAA